MIEKKNKNNSFNKDTFNKEIFLRLKNKDKKRNSLIDINSIKNKLIDYSFISTKNLNNNNKTNKYYSVYINNFKNNKSNNFNNIDHNNSNNKNDSLLNSIMKSFNIYSRNTKNKPNYKMTSSILSNSNQSNLLLKNNNLTVQNKNINDRKKTIYLYRQKIQTNPPIEKVDKYTTISIPLIKENNLNIFNVFDLNKKLKYPLSITKSNSLASLKRDTSKDSMMNNNNNCSVKKYRIKYLTKGPNLKKLKGRHKGLTNFLSIELRKSKIVTEDKIKDEDLINKFFNFKPLVIRTQKQSASLNDIKKMKKKNLVPFTNSFGIILDEVYKKSHFLKGSLDFMYPKIIIKKFYEDKKRITLQKIKQKELEKKNREIMTEKYYTIKDEISPIKKNRYRFRSV
jgi:hypothetical protein